MHYSDQAVGERARWARQSCRTQTRSWVRGWTRGKPRQATMHYFLHLFNLFQFSYDIWVVLGYIYSMFIIAFFDLLLCITFPWIIYLCPYHLLVNELLNLFRCLAAHRVLCNLIWENGFSIITLTRRSLFRACSVTVDGRMVSWSKRNGRP